MVGATSHGFGTHRGSAHREGCWRDGAGLLGGRGEAETKREQFSEEVLIAGGEKLFHLRARECSQENQAGLEEGRGSVPHTNATVNYT